MLKLNKCHLKCFVESFLAEIRNRNMTVLSSYVTSIKVICYQIYSQTLNGILTYIFLLKVLFKTYYNIYQVIYIFYKVHKEFVTAFRFKKSNPCNEFYS